MPTGLTVKDKTERFDLAHDVIDTLFEATETFEDIGGQAAYLMHAILKGEVIELDPTLSTDSDMLDVLKEAFDGNHQVWHYVEVVDIDDD